MADPSTLAALATLHLLVPELLHRHCRVQAALIGVSLAEWVRNAIRAHLATQGIDPDTAPGLPSARR